MCAAAQWNDEEEQKDCKDKGECSGAVFDILTTIPKCQCTDLVPTVRDGLAGYHTPCTLAQDQKTYCLNWSKFLIHQFFPSSKGQNFSVKLMPVRFHFLGHALPFSGLAVLLQFYAGSQTNGSCLQQVQQDNCGQPWMQKSSTDEIKSGAL